jgi:hypothetical protein
MRVRAQQASSSFSGQAESRTAEFIKVQAAI